MIVGPAEWNNLYALHELELPEDDRHLIVTFHYYAPFEFTHQGADWADGSADWLGTTWRGTSAEQEAIRHDLDVAVLWAAYHQRPLYLGEFGVYSAADMASRAAWTDFVARQAESRGMAWAYWEFCSGFGVYDPDRDVWREPLLEALVPAD